MAKSKALVTLIREIVRQEVKKEVNSIFIKEGVKAVAQNNGVPEVLPKPIPKLTNLLSLYLKTYSVFFSFSIFSLLK